jgi:hypothetical protein
MFAAVTASYMVRMLPPFSGSVEPTVARRVDKPSTSLVGAAVVS